jgi:SAM-dependent MidA family methyltransferase
MLYPAPTDSQKHRSQLLASHIRTDIAQHGSPIAFSRYMHHALYTPDLGYYSNPDATIGAKGDFTTAPEISSLFGGTLAQFLQPQLEQTPDILELGAGSGKLAEDILHGLATPPRNYYILEPSPYLRAQQQQRLGDRVQWLDSLPVDFHGVILANEVADAIPCARFVMFDKQAHEYCVNQALAWERGAVTDIALPWDMNTYPDGYTSEYRPLLAPWIAALADCLVHGCIMIIDYGYEAPEYYLPERSDGTLMCFLQHRAHDNPFLYPGLQDISAHVDFTDLIHHGRKNGLQLAGFYSQAEFLLEHGLLEMAAQHPQTTTLEQAKLSQQIQQLTLPGAMGEIFKVAIFEQHP